MRPDCKITPVEAEALLNTTGQFRTSLIEKNNKQRSYLESVASGVSDLTGRWILGRTAKSSLASALEELNIKVTRELWDPSTGEQPPENAYITENFKWKEFFRAGTILKVREMQNLQQVAFSLEIIRAYLGSPEIVIVSGFRSAEANARLRRRSNNVASNSQHLYGKAVDFRIPSLVPSVYDIKGLAEKIFNELVKVGRVSPGAMFYYPPRTDSNGTAEERNFIHYDIRGGTPFLRSGVGRE